MKIRRGRTYLLDGLALHPCVKLGDVRLFGDCARAAPRRCATRDGRNARSCSARRPQRATPTIRVHPRCEFVRDVRSTTTSGHPWCVVILGAKQGSVPTDGAPS